MIWHEVPVGVWVRAGESERELIIRSGRVIKFIVSDAFMARLASKRRGMRGPGDQNERKWAGKTTE